MRCYLTICIPGIDTLLHLGTWVPQTGRRTDAFALAGKEKQNGIQTREADGSS